MKKSAKMDDVIHGKCVTVQWTIWVDFVKYPFVIHPANTVELVSRPVNATALSVTRVHNAKEVSILSELVSALFQRFTVD